MVRTILFNGNEVNSNLNINADQLEAKFQCYCNDNHGIPNVESMGMFMASRMADSDSEYGKTKAQWVEHATEGFKSLEGVQFPLTLDQED